ncbi:MAG TPA: ribosome-associated translation inhibitor RaiA [Candidatus Doudnabacteria bacterium]|nr:ribosome-associated translation inhibitor RaiA [Candidatus Doudnabacteria bacterium]
MKINIKATNTTLTPTIKSNVESKLSVIEKFTRPEDVIYVELAEDTHHQSGMFFRVDIQISPHGIYADANGNDFYEALDLVIPKIQTQLTKSKDKKISLRRRLGNVIRGFKRSDN